MTQWTEIKICVDAQDIDKAADIANMVVPKGDVVSIIDKSGKKEVYVSELEETKYPIVVLIDENSARCVRLFIHRLMV